MHNTCIMHYYYIIVILVVLLCNKMELGFGLKFKLTKYAQHWGSAGATWYGSPNGAGSDGGSCGYGSAVSQAPFSSMITGIGPSLYKSGKECGACYLVKCTKKSHPSCSGKAVRVVITDFCPGGVCVTDSAHFDLSGTAFGAMALPGHQQKLRDAGIFRIRFARVACEYPGRTITFQIDQGSNPNYIAVVIKYEEGDGDLGAVALKEADDAAAAPNNTSNYYNNKKSSSDSDIDIEWREMQQSWGAVWKLDAGSELKPPLSFRLTSQYSNQTIVAPNVIPTNWKPGATYRSLVNF